ncbi:MAG: hypothetical protein ACKVQW_05095 [Pyrinomonadaceae bacterium]
MKKAMFILKTTGFACVLLCMAFFDCSRGPQKNTGNAAANVPAKNEKVYYLDAKNRTHSEPVEGGISEPEKYKFVEVEVVKAINPNLHAIAFEVHYETADRKKIFLGTFSLFPSDNPGKFIVPTQGKLKAEGNLILSLILSEDSAGDDKLQIAVKKMALREG